MTAVEAAEFRRAAGWLPTGIVVVATVLDNVEHAMTVSAFTTVSLEPPLVLFCAEKVARFHEAVLKAGFWSVSVLGAGARPTAAWLATRGRPLAGQLRSIPHRPGPVTGAPLLGGALAVMECQTTAVHDGGDHSIVVGLVLAASPGDGAVADATPGSEQGPLIHFRGGYHYLAGLPGPGSAQAGSRLPAKAVMPSRASSPAKIRPDSSAIAARPSATGWAGTSRSTPLVAASAPGAPRSSMPA